MGDKFVAVSPLGYKVRCSEEYWEEHIAARKDYMRDKVQFVINALQDPIVIFESNQHCDRDVYFGELDNPRLLTKVVVGGNVGDRVFFTAFPAKSFSGNINAEVVKYVRPGMQMYLH